jgi:hypothetical protein
MGPITIVDAIEKRKISLVPLGIKPSTAEVRQLQLRAV